MQLTHAQKKLAELETHRSAFEEEKSGFSEQRRVMDAAVVQLTKVHILPYHTSTIQHALQQLLPTHCSNPS